MFQTTVVNLKFNLEYKSVFLGLAVSTNTRVKWTRITLKSCFERQLPVFWNSQKAKRYGSIYCDGCNTKGTRCIPYDSSSSRLLSCEYRYAIPFRRVTENRFRDLQPTWTSAVSNFLAYSSRSAPRSSCHRDGVRFSHWFYAKRKLRSRGFIAMCRFY